jgi:ribosomal peptide maturation radical SAM protein 1
MDDFLAKCHRAFELLGGQTDAVLIVPPYADLNRPSLGVHLLQAAAAQAGLRVRVLYANLLFASLTGEDLYKLVCSGKYGWMWGERVFARSAFGLPALGYQTEKVHEQIEQLRQSQEVEVTYEKLADLDRSAGDFCAVLGEHLAKVRFHVAGSTTTFQQTGPSVALLAQVKRRKPQAITAIGGANCEGEMARGIASLAAPIDYIFSGECESVFPEFLRRAVAGEPLPTEHIVQGEACFNLDALPEPNFDEYFAQLDNVFPSWREDQKDVWLPCESSRGCWWGARHHCTFCGLNGQTMAFREKSPDRMIAEVRRLLLRYPTRLLAMIDNIIPYSYFRTVLPRLAKELPPVQMFYETKSNLTLEQVVLLRRSGVDRVQPGIEALSSSLLRRMKKGVLARQNLALLRYGRATGLGLTWNLLYEFPGDQREDYDEILALLPLIHHLPPPTGIYGVSLDRFSPYFKEPDAYGVSNLRPAQAYAWTLPPSADRHSLAYHFNGDYACAHASHPELHGLLERAYHEWRDKWKVGSAAPALSLTRGGDGYYTLMDTRGVEGTELFQFLDEEQARTVIIGGPLDRQPLAQWAIERKLAVALDGWCAPLGVTDVDTWRCLESRAPQTVRESVAAAV